MNGAESPFKHFENIISTDETLPLYFPSTLGSVTTTSINIVTTRLHLIKPSFTVIDNETVEQCAKNVHSHLNNLNIKGLFTIQTPPNPDISRKIVALDLYS